MYLSEKKDFSLVVIGYTKDEVIGCWDSNPERLLLSNPWAGKQFSVSELSCLSCRKAVHDYWASQLEIFIKMFIKATKTILGPS